MSEPKIAVIGCGYWGKNLVRNMAELGALAAVSDEHSAAAEAMARQYGVPALGMREICADKAIRGVVIATPAEFHASVAEQALSAGKHVLVEKPLALTLAGAHALQQSALRHRSVLMVGHLLQYHPAYIRLKEMIATGHIGKLNYIRSNRLSFGKVRTEESVLWSFAPHDFSMILGLTGALPQTIAAQASCITMPGVADIASVQMAFGDDVTAEINVSWLSPVKEHRLMAVGDKGMLVFDDTLPWQFKLQLFRQRVTWKNGGPVTDKAVPEPVVLEVKEPLREECRHFLDAIAGNAVRTDAVEAIRVLELLTAAERAIQKKGQIAMTLPDGVFIHETAVLDEDVAVGTGSKIWHFSHILSGSRIGRNVTIGQNVMIGPNVTVGDNCKIQNNVSLYKGVTLAEGVFCGPSCVFTNVSWPRAEIERKDEFQTTPVGKGVTIGANATIVCGHKIGAYCLIGAGAVVTKDVKPHALMIGNPARQAGWVSHAGEKLGKSLICPREGRRYRIVKGQLEEIAGKQQKKRRRSA